jgi:hypothetical protein
MQHWSYVLVISSTFLITYPLVPIYQLRSGHFPEADWPALKLSLWAPWCGYNFPDSFVITEADGPGLGPGKTLVATTKEDTGVLYMRGYPDPVGEVGTGHGGRDGRVLPRLTRTAR